MPQSVHAPKMTPTNKPRDYIFWTQTWNMCHDQRGGTCESSQIKFLELRPQDTIEVPQSVWCEQDFQRPASCAQGELPPEADVLSLHLLNCHLFTLLSQLWILS